MELSKKMGKNKITIGKNEIIAYLWQYINIVSGDIPYSSEQKLKLKTDFNFGIDKSNREFFLRKLEFLTRDDMNSYLEIDLTPISGNMPRHLDNPNEYVKHDKYCYNTLEIHRMKKSTSFIYYDRNEGKVIFNFSELDLFKFYTRMYINFEIYATEYDNRLKIESMSSENEEFLNSELIIWGVFNKDLIYY